MFGAAEMNYPECMCATLVLLLWLPCKLAFVQLVELDYSKAVQNCQVTKVALFCP